MKTKILKYAENYPEVTLILSGNNCGDQVITVEREDILGHKEIIWHDYNVEGDHQDIETIAAFVKSVCCIK